MNNFRSLINIVESNGGAVYLSADRSKSVSLSKLPAEVATAIRANLSTVGKFEFVDEGDEWFSHVTARPMPFIEAAKEATDAYARGHDTQFARLVVARYRIDAMQ